MVLLAIHLDELSLPVGTQLLNHLAQAIEHGAGEALAA